MQMNTFRKIAFLLLVLLVIISCRHTVEKQQNIVNTDIQGLREQIEIPFKVDSTYWTIIGKGDGWEGFVDYDLFAIIYPSLKSDLDSLKLQLEKKDLNYDVKYSKESFPKWFIKKSNNIILEMDNYNKIKVETYEIGLFRKGGFLHGLCFFGDDKIFVIMNTN